MRRPAVTVTLTLAAVLLTGSPAALAASTTDTSDLSPPPIPTTGTREVQFVGAGATAEHPVDEQSLVSVVVPQRFDDIYNVAVAFNDGTQAPCTGCRSVAAAMQIVLIKGKPSSLSPVNGAYAYNYQCTGCLAYAYAKQKLVYVPKDFRVDGDLRRKITFISKKVAHEVDTSETPAELDADLGALFSQLDKAVAKAVAEEQED
jgi:hypothetical protein